MYDLNYLISIYDYQLLLFYIHLIFNMLLHVSITYVFNFKNLPLDNKGNKDVYTIVINAYKLWWYVLVYEVSFIALGFHLLHGVFSAARTLGLYHPKYVQIVKISGWVYTGFITFGFMLIPIYIYLKN